MTSEPGEWTKFKFTMQVYNFRANIQSLRLSDVAYQHSDEFKRLNLSSSDDSPINLFKRNESYNSIMDEVMEGEEGSEPKTARDKEIIEIGED